MNAKDSIREEDNAPVAIVGLVDPPTRLAVLPTVQAAENFIGLLYGHEDGRYYLDYPCYID